MAYAKLSYPRSVEKTGYYLNFYAYDYNKAQSLGVKSIRDMLSGATTDLAGNNADFMQNLSIEQQERVQNAEETYGLSNKTFDRNSDIPANSSLGCVKLYIPSTLEYKYSANWNKVSFGALGSALGGGGEALGAGLATGVNVAFDKFVKDNPNTYFAAIYETDRGCPFKCTFCDWGSATASKVNKFDLYIAQTLFGLKYHPFVGQIANNFSPYLMFSTGPLALIDVPEYGKLNSKIKNTSTYYNSGFVLGFGADFMIQSRQTISIFIGYDHINTSNIVDGRNKYNGTIIKLMFGQNIK